MDAYCVEVRKLKKHFLGLEFHYVIWDFNITTDKLAKQGSDRAAILSGIYFQEFLQSSIKEATDASIDMPMPNKQVMVVSSD